MFKKIAELDQLVEESNSGPVIIYKHSSTCGGSARAYDEISAFMESSQKEVYLGNPLIPWAPVWQHHISSARVQPHSRERVVLAHATCFF